MIKVQDWIASIPDEEKHIAYVGEGLTEQREFLLCGNGWEQYQAYAFHLDMAFDPASVTTTDSRQVVQTTCNSTEQKEEAAVIIDEVTTKETYTVNDVQVTNHYLSDIAPLSKVVKSDGIHLTWTVLRQHTVLPGKLWATIRAVGSESGQIKKSAIMVFEVDPAICAVPSAVPPVSEFEQMERQMDALRMLTETAADDAADAADKATSSADEALRSATTATGAADSALNSMWQALTASDEAQQSADSAKAYVQQAQEAAEAAASHTTAAEQAASRAETHQQSAAQHAASAALSNQGAQLHCEEALDAAEQCNHSVALCEEYANEAKASARPYRRINVRDYGAVGDGIANDQPAIWAAITAAKALIAEDVPCELYFPAGTYGILEGGIGIKLPQGKGGLRIAGAGREITTIQYLEEWQNGGSYGNGWYALDISPEGSPTHWDYNTYIHDVAITGLTIRDDYPDKHATHTAKGTADNAAWGEENHGVNIGYCVRAAVTDCTLINLGDEVVDIYSCEDTIVMNNHIEGCPAAGPSGGAITIADGSKGAVVSGNTITRSGEDYVLTADDFDGEDGITLKAGVEMSGRVELPDGSVIARYTVLEQDTFIPVGTKIIKNNYGVAVESLYTPVSDVVITGNTIRDMHGKAMNLGCPNAGSSIDNVIIADNVMIGCDRGICLSGTHPKRGVKIQNNIISDCLNEAILTTAVEDITISGNTFRNIKGDLAVNTANYGTNSRQLISDNVFENIENTAVYCNGTTMIKDCLFNGVGTSETPLATKSPAIVKAGGTLTVSGCVMKDVRLKGVSCGIQNADYIEHTDIELVKSDGTINAGGDAIKGDATKRIIGGKMGGRITIAQDNAIVQGVSIVSSNIGSQAISVNANGVIVTGCNINLSSGSYPAIAEGAGKNHNLFANNIVNRSITTVGAQSMAVNNIDTRVTA
ncbi:MAG: right-handed parallel beta-helix repeat-containing protein [Clostridia bacterium]|nr:right-handed parallel beta-helix repeat-containing protein [Clostridia bacterium]